ncbi:TetR family transcriptional regulator [Rhizobium calliandrae]|uniref:TetR family transcriptional regulator n=1 Tax=Rhizobium calliandrae TaxID=1312182 RepID=A0ABT7KDX8_9HYPH|nr:TetR family transcriptional regulator [Rhizobium calliandrae]MDL2406831.1 TetR family transcriptional regulator [Rhizobium calliandrae]
MRKSNLEAAQTRREIVVAAADELRQHGIAEASLSDIMAAAGLTAGGFYRHFRSKDQLVAEALVAAGADLIENLKLALASDGFNGAVDAYLSSAGPDGAGIPNCPFSALGSEIARAAPETRDALTLTLENLLSTFETGTTGGKPGRRNAVVALATMVGALTLARISTKAKLSSEIVEIVRKDVHRAP